MNAHDIAEKLNHGCDPVWAEAEIRGKIASLAPTAPLTEWWLLLALALARQNRLVLAEETCRFTLSLQPENRATQGLLAQILSIREEYRNRPYTRRFQLARPRYRDYPQYVAIETVGRCNATCSFCPNPRLERRHSAMDDDLFHKIIADLTAIPRNHPFTITPSLVNEPLMDPKLFERCRHINEQLPQVNFSFYSNLSFLPPGFTENLATLRNVGGWNVSFNSADPDEYLRVMGLPFERTVANITTLLRFLREQPLFPGPVILSRIEDGTAGDDRYRQTCASLFPEFAEGRDFEVQCRPRTDWLGRVDTPKSEIPHCLPCNAWFSLYVFCDGRVPHCCMDSHGDYAIGDVRKQSVLEVYNNPGFRNLREHQSVREGVDPCNRCPLRG